MKCDKHTMLLYAVTDRAWVGEQTLYQQVESALKGGATCVQLREKHLDDADFLQEAIEIHALCQQYGVPLFINDNVDVAVKCHAEGIHVGQSDMAAAKVRERVGEDMMIGVSAHTVQEALDAVAHGADCLGVGAAFATHTKEDVNVLPRQTLIDICNAVDVAVVAIGGWKGVRTLLGLGFTGAMIAWLILPGIYHGLPSLPLTVAALAVCTLVSLLLLNPPSPKTWAAMLSTLAGVALAAVLAFCAVLPLLFQQSRSIETGSWGLSFRTEGQPPAGNASKEALRRYDAVYLGDETQKKIYLTFDAGYENGCTEPILEALAKHGVKAAFFVVGNYIEQNRDLVRRMLREGHIVGNHTYHLYDMS